MAVCSMRSTAWRRAATQAPRTWQLANAAINRLLWTPDGLTLVAGPTPFTWTRPPVMNPLPEALRASIGLRVDQIDTPAAGD